MGMSHYGKLVYGYALGGPDDGWEIEESGEYGELNLGWYDPDDDEALATGFIEAAERRLLVDYGFIETDWRAEGYFARERAAHAGLGVRFETHSHLEYPSYVLITYEVEVCWGERKVLDLAELTRMPEEQGWDRKLSNALRVLGMTPKQAEPGWLLLAHYT